MDLAEKNCMHASKQAWQQKGTALAQGHHASLPSTVGASARPVPTLDRTTGPLTPSCRANVDLYAPGTDIPVPDVANPGTYTLSSGTSQSAPLVAAAAALVQAKGLLLPTRERPALVCPLLYRTRMHAARTPPGAARLSPADRQRGAAACSGGRRSQLAVAHPASRSPQVLADLLALPPPGPGPCRAPVAPALQPSPILAP